MSELRWLDGGQPSEPDPNRDRHVAFPDDAGTPSGATDTSTAESATDDPHRDLAIEVVGTGRNGQPVSARISLAPSVQWGWRAGELPGTPRGSRPRRRRHKNRLVPGLIALGLVALVLRSGGSVESSSSGTSGQVCFGDCPDAGAPPGFGKGPEVGVAPAPLRVTVLPAGQAEGRVMTEPRDDVGTMPDGPSSVRVEVVSNDGSSAYVAVTNEGGGFEKVVSLPFAARVTVPDGTVPFGVTAVSDGDSATVQCRVYAGSHLVATSTAVGTVKCVPTPAAR